MASTELGFLALPQFLKGTPELSILPSPPPLDPFAGIIGRRQGMGRLFPRQPPDWWCRGSGPQRKLVGGWLAVMLAFEGLGREGVLQTKDQSRPGPLAGGLALVLPLISLFLRGGSGKTGLGKRWAPWQWRWRLSVSLSQRVPPRAGGLVPGSPKQLHRGLGRGVLVVLHRTLAL